MRFELQPGRESPRAGARFRPADQSVRVKKRRVNLESWGAGLAGYGRLSAIRPPHHMRVFVGRLAAHRSWPLPTWICCSLRAPSLPMPSRSGVGLVAGSAAGWIQTSLLKPPLRLEKRSRLVQRIPVVGGIALVEHAAEHRISIAPGGSAKGSNEPMRERAHSTAINRRLMTFSHALKRTLVGFESGRAPRNV